MSKQYPALEPAHISFISEQKLFFVGTAAAEGRVNVSPKGMDTLRVLSPHRIVWLGLTGSGNETAGHVQSNPRMTLMFVSFARQPLIFRVYGTAKVHHRLDPQWDELAALFDPLPGARQIFDLAVELSQESCGFAVPFYDYRGERGTLAKWAKKKGSDGIEQYWQLSNTATIDGVPTNIETKKPGQDRSLICASGAAFNRPPH